MSNRRYHRGFFQTAEILRGPAEVGPDTIDDYDSKSRYEADLLEFGGMGGPPRASFEVDQVDLDICDRS